MKTHLYKYQHSAWQSDSTLTSAEEKDIQLVLSFACKEIAVSPKVYEQLRSRFPNAQIAINSTSGEIYQQDFFEDSLVAVAIKFEKTQIKTARVNINQFENSFDAGLALIKKLDSKDLVYVLVLSDGNLVNGSQLVKGLNTATENKVLITGGLAGDGDRFESTVLGLNEAPVEGNIIAIGFYGNNIIIKHGSEGGWQMFGPEREVTRSVDNCLFEIDQKSAFDLYRRYLGPFEDNVPLSTLLFPLGVILPGNSQPLVRTILSLDKENNSMIFAGDVPEGSQVKFMKASTNNLIKAAENAARSAFLNSNLEPDLTLLISCIGRKLIMGPRVDEEIEAITSFNPKKSNTIGFYSYGEISPFNDEIECQLNNETMTVTAFYEF